MKLMRRLLIILVPLAMLLLGAWGDAIGQAEPGGAAPNLVFEHAKTGFILDNAHKLVGCESCHTAGTFRGTPKVCSTCHAGAGARAPGKSIKHIPTAAATCDSCHGTIAWQPARMNHNAVGTIACSSCHNGIFTDSNSLAKPVTHVPTNAACNSCHTSVTAFSPATMNHAGTAGQCNTCHSGAFVSANAQTKGPNHVATTAQCDQCHPSTATWFASVFDHVATPPVNGRCADCHNGSRALGKPARHIPTTVQCDTCHTNTVSFLGARMDHSGTNGSCSNCHSGTFTAVNALAKPATHVSTTAQCDNCHQSTVSWLGAKFDHTTVTPAVAGRCATCHNGSTAMGKQAFAAHIPTTASCDVCHTGFTAFGPARMNHAGAVGPVATGNCSSCHSGAYLSSNAQTKSATHSPTNAQCDTCHASTISWATATWNHSAGDTNCASCHNNNPTVGMPTTHIPTAAQCSNCHKNTTSFRPAAMDHTGQADCRSCHGGGYVYANALAKPTTHIPTAAQCSTCHTGFVVFAPASMSHAGTSGPVAAGNCATCHSGAYLAVNAQVRPVSHIPTGTQSCDACHGTTAWKPTTFSHAGVTIGSGTCATNCHDGTHALGKPPTHLPTTAACDVCHTNFTAFAPARMNHAGTTGPAATVNSGTCSTCHSGTYLAINAQIKPASHVSTTAQCDSCHTSTASWATKVFNHASASPAAPGNCSTCHNGTTALGKPTTHIPTTAQCDTCHGNFNAFRPATMSHTGTTGPIAPGNCSLCHGGGYLFANALAKPTTHVLTNMQCDTCHTGGYVSWTGAKFVHAATAVGACSTCHNGATALGKPSTHIPTTAQCDTCHGNYVGFKPAAMNHTGTAAQCATCHSGTYTAVNALAKPLSHIPTGAQCDTCHNNGFQAFMPSPMNHSGTITPVATGNCITCHGDSAPYLIYNAQHKSVNHVADNRQCDTCHKSTTTWATATYTHLANAAGTCDTCHKAGGSGLPKPTTHIPTTAQCDTCHNSYTAFAPATMNHVGTANNCLSCHNGSYITVNAQARSATHIPTGAQSCDACHGTVAWKPTTYAHNGVTMGGGTCGTCHNGTNALGKAASHLPTGAACDTCHTNFAAFAPTKMNHAGTNTPVAAGNCATCHSGTYLAINAQIKPATHIPTANQCDSCHNSTTTWATRNMTHDASAVGTCSTCHNGTSALGKPTTHIPTTAQCDTCHKNYTAFRPAAMSHPGTAGPVAVGNCSTCHGGGYVAVNALAKPTTHIPVTGQCDTCHTKGYTAWSPATMSHTGLTSCSTCHSGAYVSQNAQIKPATHIPTTAQCSTCHASTTTWATGTFNHTGVAAGSCATCHNGTNALGKPTTHIPTTATCDTCHKNTTAFAPATMTHNATTTPAGSCANCHNGGYTAVNAQSKPVTHIPTTQSCEICHTTTAWKPTSFSHTGIVSGCSTCHNGTAAAGKPALHITPPGGQECNVCHRTGIAWLPLITPYAHTGATVCANCHSGAYPNIDIKSAAHLPTTTTCDVCHNTTVWSPMKLPYAHTGIATGTCQTCHTGTYTGVLGKPANHIPTTSPAGMPGNECSLCHSSKTTFTTEKMNHGTMQTSCATCHDKASPYLGTMDKITRGSGHHNSAGKDCSSSGCHRPLGSKGTAYTKWN